MYQVNRGFLIPTVLITTRIWICPNGAFVLRVKGMMFVTTLGPHLVGFGAEMRTDLLQRACAVFTDSLSVINVQRNANVALSVRFSLSATPVLYLGSLTQCLPRFGEGEEKLLVLKKRNSNQFKWELGAASRNSGQYVRLLQSSRNRAVNQATV